MKPTKRNPSAAELLAGRMADDIRSGVLAPGAWLKQVDLEARYAAKRITVRQALARLTQDRLTQHFPNRGYRVYQIDGRQFREIRQIRTRLELMASETMLDNVTDAIADELYDLAQAYFEAVTRGTPMDQIKCNRGFNHRLLDLTSNRELAAFTIEMRQRTPSALTHRWRTHEQVKRRAELLFVIVQALRDRDLPALQDAIRAQEETTLKDVKDFL